jgi:hypothetical protein
VRQDTYSVSLALWRPRKEEQRVTASLAREHALKRRGPERKDGCGSVPDVVHAGPDDPMGGGIKEIVLARS